MPSTVAAAIASSRAAGARDTAAPPSEPKPAPAFCPKSALPANSPVVHMDKGAATATVTAVIPRCRTTAVRAFARATYNNIEFRAGYEDHVPWPDKTTEEWPVLYRPRMRGVATKRLNRKGRRLLSSFQTEPKALARVRHGT